MRRHVGLNLGSAGLAVFLVSGAVIKPWGDFLDHWLVAILGVVVGVAVLGWIAHDIAQTVALHWEITRKLDPSEIAWRPPAPLYAVPDETPDPAPEPEESAP